MSDLTSRLNELLKKHNVRLKHSPRTRSDTRDEFLKEAYRIVNPPITLPPFPLILAKPSSPRMSTSSTSNATSSPSAPLTSPPRPHRAVTPTLGHPKSVFPTATNHPNRPTSTTPPATPSMPTQSNSSATSPPPSVSSPKPNPSAAPPNPRSCKASTLKAF